jgi:hypothetical protein
MKIKPLGWTLSDTLGNRVRACMELDGGKTGHIRAMTDVEYAQYILEQAFCPTGQETTTNRSEQ